MTTKNIDVTETINNGAAEIDQVTQKYFPVMQEAINGMIKEMAPINRKMFDQLQATQPHAAELYEAQNLMAMMCDCIDGALRKAGMSVNPHLVAGVAVSGFASYVQNSYAPGEPDSDAVPDISEMIFSLAHGRTSKIQS